MLQLRDQGLDKTIPKVSATADQSVFVDSQLSPATARLVEEQIRLGNVALVLTNGLEAFPLVSGLNTLGRDKHCRIKLDDPVVSRQHANIHVGSGQLVLTDLLSTNGTYVNGRRVQSATVLVGGDRIRMGRLEFIVASIAG